MRLVSIHEAAREIGISEMTLRRRVADGTVPHIMLGNRTIVDVDDVALIMIDQEGLSVKELSEATGLSVGAVRRGVSEGWIPSIGKGGSGRGYAYKFDLDEVREVIKKLMITGKKKP